LNEDREVRVLLQSGRRVAAFTGANTGAGRLLDPAKTYTARARPDGLLSLRGPRGRELATSIAPLRVTGPGPLVLWGTALNGRVDGAYRGALEVRPAPGGVNAINAVGLEDYVQGVVPTESPSTWPIEALKAQAVAARTYAATTGKGGDGWDQYPDTRSQVYGGVFAETPSTNEATAETRGQLVTYEGTPVVTFFFSTSGGQTENVENTPLGTEPEPWLRSVDDPYDDVSPKHRWGPIRMTYKQAGAKLRGLVLGRFRGIDVVTRGASPRVISADVLGSKGTTPVSGATLRARFGLYDTWAYFTSIAAAPAPPPTRARPPAARSRPRAPPAGPPSRRSRARCIPRAGLDGGRRAPGPRPLGLRRVDAHGRRRPLPRPRPGRRRIPRPVPRRGRGAGPGSSAIAVPRGTLAPRDTERDRRHRRGAIARPRRDARALETRSGTGRHRRGAIASRRDGALWGTGDGPAPGAWRRWAAAGRPRRARALPDDHAGRDGRGDVCGLLQAERPIERLGIGSFGPVDVDPASPTWGNVTTTPKPGWAHTPVAKPLAQGLGIGVVFDTDVNAAALGEYRWGAGQGSDPFVLRHRRHGDRRRVVSSGRPVHGLMHPELGHVRIPHDLQRDPYGGSCPYHGDCFEGLACGPAIQQRWACRAASCPTTIPRGRWRRTTWPAAWSRSPASSRRTRSCCRAASAAGRGCRRRSRRGSRSCWPTTCRRPRSSRRCSGPRGRTRRAGARDVDGLLGDVDARERLGDAHGLVAALALEGELRDDLGAARDLLELLELGVDAHARADGQRGGKRTRLSP
jgi:stage II sporulation protein D